MTPLIEVPVYGPDRKWTGEWTMQRERISPTLDSLRNPARYWVVSAVKLQRDLKPRTLDDVYRENRAGRIVVSPACVAQTARPGTRDWDNLLHLYGAYMRKLRGKKWKPHPASVDPEHPIAKQREGLRYVKREG